jgi:hypothetical protein
MTDERKQGIIDMAAPTNVKQVRSFVGMIGFMRDFIPNLSQLLEPLTDLTKKSKKFVWNKKAEESFQAVKSAVANLTMLYHLQPQGKIILYTDASLSGVGAVLVQIQNDVQRPIIFLSKKFSDAARKWSTIEQECFAIFWAITKLSSYLLGRHFFVATDHRNLVYINHSDIPKLVRWRLKLMEFSFTIIHIPGEENLVADTLSRLNRLIISNGVQQDTDQILRSIHNSLIGHHGFGRTYRMANTVIKNIRDVWPQYKNDSRIYIASNDHDEFKVDSIVDHSGNMKQKGKMKFRVRWTGYDPNEDTWLPYREVKDLEALDYYLEQHPELQF